jgi:SAM-dependent methyltransferase
MNLTPSHYNRHYYAAVAADLLDDPEYYALKSQCAAKLYFQRFPEPYGRILEYGCGLGQNIASLDSAVGFDISPASLALCRQRGLATVAREAEIPRGGFDYVLCRHVLEHVDQPLEVLRRLLEYLRDDGLLILVLPCEHHRRVELEPDVHRHLYCWNFRAVNNLIWRAGGIPVHNRYEPMFGPRTYAALRPVWRWLGGTAYFHAGRLIGRLLGQYELVVHARPAPEGRLPNAQDSSHLGTAPVEGATP